MKPVLIISAAMLGTLALVAGLAFMFGTPQAPDLGAYATGSGSAPQAIGPGLSPADESAAAPGMSGNVPITEDAEVPEPDPSVPLAIEIPGCKCHSDDPKIVEEHSKYRMNQCAGCHAGETPTGM